MTVTYYDLAETAANIASTWPETVAAAAVEACRLVYVDRNTLLRDEFPELERVVASYLIPNRAEAEIVAESRFPTSATSRTPAVPAAKAVSVATRMAEIAYLWVNDKRPKSSSDPYKVRQKAVAILRTLAEDADAPALDVVIALAFTQMSTEAVSFRYFNAFAEIRAFMAERMASLMSEEVSAESVSAVLSAYEAEEFSTRTVLEMYNTAREVAALAEEDRDLVTNVIRRARHFIKDTTPPEDYEDAMQPIRDESTTDDENIFWVVATQLTYTIHTVEDLVEMARAFDLWLETTTILDANAPTTIVQARVAAFHALLAVAATVADFQ